eukprot:symbB.v1.2.008675.t1/scaffold539.1/size189864/7
MSLKGGVAVAWTWIFLLLFTTAVPALLLLLIGWLIPRRRSAKGSVGQKIRVAFVHPDLGIGGAERLVVDAALALQQQGHEVEMFTARHEEKHCFEETRNGTLKVHVFGGFLPRRVLGRFYAACAYLRMCWVSFRIVLQSLRQDFHVIIVDQVSICLPLLRLARPRGIIFYCHYPDYLLTTKTSVLKRLYRLPLDFLEECTTGLADEIFVNSSFTAGVFAEAFPLLDCLGVLPSVLYPPLNLQDQDQLAKKATDLSLKFMKPGEQLLLSINRFERKKNVGLAIRTLAALPSELRSKTRLALAGGYDERLPENVEHAAELQALAESLGVAERVVQMRSVSALQKASLLHHAATMLYTPDREHFGIVPVEAMYAQLPVVAVNSGGPLESIVENETGFLRAPEPKAWADCVAKLLSDPQLRRNFGEAGRRRAREHFSLEAFGKRLHRSVEQLDAGRAPKEQELVYLMGSASHPTHSFVFFAVEPGPGENFSSEVDTIDTRIAQSRCDGGSSGAFLWSPVTGGERVALEAPFDRTEPNGLVLPAPRLVLAEFLSSGRQVMLSFDRPTLMGAVPRDTDGDGLADTHNEADAWRRNFPCSWVVGVKSLQQLLLSDATCTWMTEQELVIDLPVDGPAEVGSAFFLRAAKKSEALKLGARAKSAVAPKVSGRSEAEEAGEEDLRVKAKSKALPRGSVARQLVPEALPPAPEAAPPVLSLLWLGLTGLEKALESSVEGREGRGVKRAAPEDEDFAAMAAAVKGHKSMTPKQLKAPSQMVSPNYEERDAYRLAHQIRAWSTAGSGQVVAVPWAHFEHANIPPALLHALQTAGFQAPTPIQAQVWPVAAKGSDIIGIARTGSGKTLAYLYPAYLWMSRRAQTGIRSLLLAPTRELATQIHEEATKFAKASGYASACVYGGVPKKEQLPAVRAGAPILVATPGRLNDFLEFRQIILSSVGYLVFDEADRMLDMGFEPQIRDIVKQLPKQRQTLMFSATWPEEVQTLAHDFMKDAVSSHLLLRHVSLPLFRPVGPMGGTISVDGSFLSRLTSDGHALRSAFRNRGTRVSQLGLGPKRTEEDSGKPPAFPVVVQCPRRVSVTFGTCEIYNVGSEEEVEASHFVNEEDFSHPSCPHPTYRPDDRKSRLSRSGSSGSGRRRPVQFSYLKPRRCTV